MYSSIGHTYRRRWRLLLATERWGHTIGTRVLLLILSLLLLLLEILLLLLPNGLRAQCISLLDQHLVDIGGRDDATCSFAVKERWK